MHGGNADVLIVFVACGFSGFLVGLLAGFLYLASLSAPCSNAAADGKRGQEGQPMPSFNP